MTAYTINGFDPGTGTIEVQFENWSGPLAVPVTLDALGMLPTGAELDAQIGLYAPKPEEVARIASVANAPNQDELNALIGTSRTADLPPPPPEVPPQTAINLGVIQPGETIPQVSVVI